MRRIYNDYKKEYGDVPNNTIDRFLKLLDDKKITDKDLITIREKTKSILGMKRTKIHLVIHLLPKATPRPRLTKFGTFYVKGAKVNKNLFRDYIKEVGGMDLIQTATRMTVDTYFPIPSNMNRIDSVLAELRLIRPLSRPDWDNLGKTYSDMITEANLLLLEDSLVVDGRTRKFYSSKPRIEIILEYQDGFDSLYNKRKVESWKDFKKAGVDSKENV